MAIRKLTPGVFDRVWGSPLTQPWLENPEGRHIGEIWYSAPEVLPVLVKFLFTSERLSVQVHPNDAYARLRGEARGKTEMWHVLRAEPGATIALGLREPVTAERLRDSALSGEIVELLQWLPASAGDTFFVPAGTIHAIGGGLVICEIQQLSDVTYRLYDYQRRPERTLHLEDSVAVALREPGHGPRCQSTSAAGGGELLAECEYFRTERLHVNGAARCPAADQAAIYVAIRGDGWLAGEPFRAGEAWLAAAGNPGFTIHSPDADFIIASAGPGAASRSLRPG